MRIRTMMSVSSHANHARGSIETNNEAVKASNDVTNVNIEVAAIDEKGDKKDLLASSA